MKNFNKKFGFTLAEVLITIGIIGIVAAITIPNLGTEISKKQRSAQFKSIYAQMQTITENINATGKVYKCYACPSGSDDMDAEDFTGTDVADFGLKYSLKGGCSPKNSQCDKFFEKFNDQIGIARTCNDNIENCVGSNYTDKLNLNSNGCFNSIETAHILENGMILLFGETEENATFAIDLNGKKGPNIWGNDIYPFAIKAVSSNKLGDKAYVTKIGVLPPANCELGNISTAQRLKEISGR